MLDKIHIFFDRKYYSESCLCFLFTSFIWGPRIQDQQERFQRPWAPMNKRRESKLFESEAQQMMKEKNASDSL